VLTETSLQTQLTVNAFCRSHTPPVKVSLIFHVCIHNQVTYSGRFGSFKAAGINVDC